MDIWAFGGKENSEGKRDGDNLVGLFSLGKLGKGKCAGKLVYIGKRAFVVIKSSGWKECEAFRALRWEMCGF